MLYEIHRYPADLIDVLHVAHGERTVRVVVRPVLPQDDAPTAAFFAALSQQGRRNRFMSPLREVAPRLITAFTHIDYEGHVALVAETFEEGVETVIAEARYVRGDDGRRAEFAVTVAEAWQGRGLAKKLLAKLACHAGASGVEVLEGETLAGNAAMLHLARQAGFTLTPDRDVPGIVRLERRLPQERAHRPCGASVA